MFMLCNYCMSCICIVGFFISNFYFHVQIFESTCTTWLLAHGKKQEAHGCLELPALLDIPGQCSLTSGV